MKRLLTVLLCIAVIFTFSFSGAFAYMATPTKYEANEKLAEVYLSDALEIIDGTTDSAVDGIVISDGQSTPSSYSIPYSILKDKKSDLLDAAISYFEATGHYIGENLAGVDANAYNTSKSTYYTIDDLIKWDKADADTAGAYTDHSLNVKGNGGKLYKELVYAAFEADKQEVLDVLSTVSLSKFSTKELSEDCYHTVKCDTYKDHVQAILDEVTAQINSYKYTEDTTIATFAYLKGGLDSVLGNYDADATKSNRVGNVSTGAPTLIAEKVGGTYEVNLDYKDVYTDASAKTGTLDDYTKDSVESQDAVDDANAAQLKAQVAKAKAAYIKNNNKTAQKEYADNVQEALNYLIDKEVIKTNNIGTYITLSDIYPSAKETSSNGSSEYATKAEKACKIADELNDKAAQYKAETNDSGVLVRDSEDVDKILEKGLKAVYALGVGKDSAEYASKSYAYAKISDLQTAVDGDMDALYVGLDDERLAYYKKLTVNWLDNYYEDVADSDLYYDKELAKLKDLIDKAETKVNAATKNTDVDKAVEDFMRDGLNSDIKAKQTITGWTDKLQNVSSLNSEVKKLVEQAKSYMNLLNSKAKKDGSKYAEVSRATNGTADFQTEEGGKYQGDMALVKAICDMVGASDARTDAEISKLTDEVEAAVESLATKDEVEAAGDAAQNAIDALPKTIKVADKSSVNVAIKAIDNYEDLTCDYGTFYVPGENQTKQAQIVKKFAAAVANDYDDQYDKLKKTDKDGLEALKDKIEAFEDEYDDYGSLNDWTTLKKLKDDIQDDLDDIQETAYNDVVAAINKIPAKANITEAATDVVKAARKAYNAYVEDYTDASSDMYYKFPGNSYGQFYSKVIGKPGAISSGLATDDYGTVKAFPKDGAKADGFVADDFGTYYTTLVNAEALLGLNQKSPAELVKELKIVVSSKATKGSIKLTWKIVDGDASAADGYQVWKSTKHSKGYKKIATVTKKSYTNKANKKGTNLKKNTRYYYKVRAYKVVDGKKVYSDWSNKARRVAK